MTENESPKKVIDSYRKQQQRAKRAPLMLVIAAILLIAGAALIILWVTGENPPSIGLFSKDTPTSTFTQTASPVPPTDTPTQTSTQAPPTNTLEPSLTPTLSGPVIYIAQEGDSLYSIAETFDMDVVVLLVVNLERLNLDPANPIIAIGDEVLIPAPGTELPTPTPLPVGLPYGYQIEYMVYPGDSLELLAFRYNSTVDDIMETNELTNANAIYVGQILVIRINLVTPVPTNPSTAAPAGTPGSIATLTPTP